MAAEQTPDPSPDDDPTPAPLRRIVAFVNTRRADGDIVSTPEELVRWLREHELVPPGVAATADQHHRARAVREGLRALIAENNAAPIPSPHPDGLDPAARATFTRLAHTLPLTLDVAAHPPRLVPRTSDPVDAALATLLADVAHAAATGEWTRLKACREPSCRWAFHDHSRNHRRTWCSAELCGNRAKARAFHRRKATTDTGGPTP